MSSNNEGGLSQVIQYVRRYMSHKYGYSGSLWEGRFKSSLVDSELFVSMPMR